mmetsp:Transcript_18162/g.72745  ORF Transcript_18162/g.72745 Transcript_18162/m.72745 type:complete len:633 (-) Transcript_18162:504-2402(-)|eukprot:CAMPEP_0113962340 /NCGR_PEP_ID=MMETSP0011_2-20120614/5857_1 /TAXON_ID=101924 /ORGANISM="Rhodosorus marinus" /LENGTH=632 /DNA_ID=CAMNT_0000974175 /DNA_START=967 /DNA_END=2865 /DNA_ORIENTATION=- /assembly_acc=CAM_ASM_000156
MEVEHSLEDRIRIKAEVANALSDGRPVVALESTIIAHGMPYPENLATAKMLENVVRANGAVPATIAVLGGFLRIGLEEDELELLATEGQNMAKVSRRDLAAVISSGGNGATTVAGTIIACELSGIKVFATGGIGGVHRGAEHSFDESADLVELSRSSVCVVSAGVKSILDIPKTLERLETLGVSVVTLSADEFPAFYMRKSGKKSPRIAESEAEVARILSASRGLSLASGTLVAVPIPEQFEAKAVKLNQAIDRAIDEAEQNGITGAEITPFVLSKVAQYTGGEALATNRRLAENNAAVAARIAAEYCHCGSSSQANQGKLRARDGIVVIGATVLDIYTQPEETQNGMILGTSNPGTVRTSFGGVARNVAAALGWISELPVDLITAVGDDLIGSEAVSSLKHIGLPTGNVIRKPGFRTATYVAVHGQDGDMHVAVVDTSLYDSGPFFSVLRNGSVLRDSRYAIVDANLQVAELKLVAEQCLRYGVELMYEPTSVPKSTRMVRTGCLNAVSWMFPNEAEVVEMATAAAGRRVRSPHEGAEVLLNMGVSRVVITRGSKGADLCRKTEPRYIHFPAVKVERVVNTTGAGDVLAAGVVHAIATGRSDIDAMKFATHAASRSLLSHEAAPKSILSKL